MKIYICGDAVTLADGIKEISSDLDFVAEFSEAEACDLRLETHLTDEAKIDVSLKDNIATVNYCSTSTFFRALSHLMKAINEGKNSFEFSEPVKFTLNGPMFDVSQGNAVINIPTLRWIIRKMALMGLNMLMLYCEDSYEVPEQPYFGYMRSRYSKEELKELDKYALLFGIEMIPCIQTLAHLQAVLKWKVYKDFSDHMDTLLVGDERTYEFISQIIKAATEPFSSKRVHIGMDEAMMIGRGNYLKLHGLVPKAQILKEHLDRVMEIIREQGLEPMMWGDMFLRVLDEKNNDYYADVEITDEVRNTVPEDLTLVYWDYYHYEPECYEKMIDKHRLFGEPVFAGGIWTWLGFGPSYIKTVKTLGPAMKGCKNKGVKEAMATIWGDNGTECSVIATMPMLCFFAEHGFCDGDIDFENMKSRFDFIFKSSYDDFMLLQKVDEVPGVIEGNWWDNNCSKPLLWQDLISGLCDYNFRDLPLNDHYKELNGKLNEVETFKEFFDVYRNLTSVLSLKAEAGLRLRKAYLEKDKEQLSEFVEKIIPEITERVKKLRIAHMKNWFKTCKPLGWDIIDMRYGALLARLDSAAIEIKMYLDGELDTIQELDEPRIPYNGEDGIIHYANYYGKFVSASRIDPKPVYPHYLG